MMIERQSPVMTRFYLAVIALCFATLLSNSIAAQPSEVLIRLADSIIKPIDKRDENSRYAELRTKFRLNDLMSLEDRKYDSLVMRFAWDELAPLIVAREAGKEEGGSADPKAFFALLEARLGTSAPGWWKGRVKSWTGDGRANEAYHRAWKSLEHDSQLDLYLPAELDIRKGDKDFIVKRKGTQLDWIWGNCRLASFLNGRIGWRWCSMRSTPIPRFTPCCRAASLCAARI